MDTSLFLVLQDYGIIKLDLPSFICVLMTLESNIRVKVMLNIFSTPWEQTIDTLLTLKERTIVDLTLIGIANLDLQIY